MRLRYHVLVSIFLMLSSHPFAQSAKDTTAIKELINQGVELINVDNARAIKVFNDALEKSYRIKYDYGIGSSLARLGYIEGHEGRHMQGIEITKKALFHFEKIGRVKGMVTCYINLGYNYDILAMADSALFYFQKGIQLLEETRSEPGKLARLYENVGTVFGNRKEFPKAIEYSNKAIAIARSMNDSDYLVTACCGLSNIYIQQKKFEPGLQAAEEARRHLPYKEDPVLGAKVYSCLASCYVGINKPDAAIVAASKSMGYSAVSAPDHYIAAGLDLADAYELKKDYSSEKRILDALRQKAEPDTNLFHLFSIYERMAAVNYLTANYKEAFDYHQKFVAYKDSFFSHQSRRDLAEIEARYQASQKEKALSEKQLQLAQQKLALEKSNRYILVAVAILVAITLLAIGIFLQSRSRKKSFALKLNALQKQKEIDMLEALMQGEEKERSRIAKDLHDGVAGMLAAAKMHLSSQAQHTQGLSGSNSYRQSMQLLDEAASEIRKTSHNLMPELLLHRGLDEALKRYCNNISNTKLKIQYDSWGQIPRFNNSFELSVYRIVQELLSNIVKHSMASEAIVQLSKQGNILSITVEDNGVGFTKDNSTNAGMGIQNLRSRINAMKGKLELETIPGSGVSAYLEFETTSLIKTADIHETFPG